MKKAIMLILAIMAMGAYVNHIEADAPVTFYQVKVRGGDTIWKFAEESAKAGEDIRNVVCQIKEDSGIKDEGALQPGTVLNIRR